jgi:hypothetical protein
MVGCVTQQNDPKKIFDEKIIEQNVPQLRFDGVYYKEDVGSTGYFIFFENGTVINVTVIGRFNNTIFRWFNENYNEQIGNYSLSDDQLYFIINYPGDIIIGYNGVITNSGLLVNSRSSNGFERNDIEINFRRF